MEEKKSNNLQKQSSSLVQSRTKKKNKNRYYNNGNKYYYHKKKKQSKNNGLDESKSIESKEVEKTIPRLDLNEIKEHLNEKDNEREDLIITKELSFSFNNPNDLKNKEMIEDLKTALDIFYYEEEMGKFTIKDEKKHLKQLPSVSVEDTENNKKEEKSKLRRKRETLNDIQPIIEFKSEPIKEKKNKKKSNKSIFDDQEVVRETIIDKIKRKKDDLIVTREINFDCDVKDLKKKKVLKELNNAINEFDNASTIKNENDINKFDAISDIKEDKEEIQKDKIVLEKKKNSIENDIPEDIVLPKMKEEINKKEEKYLDTQLQPMVAEDKFTQILNKIDLEEKLKDLAESESDTNYLAESFLNLKNNKDNKLQYDTNNKKIIFWIFGILIVLIIFIVIVIDYIKEKDDEGFISASYAVSVPNTIDRETLYNQCLLRTYQTNDKSVELVNMEQSITDYIKGKYNVSIMYQDINTAYSFGYKTAELYYAASTIKVLDALYVYTKASEGLLDLDITIPYTSVYYDLNSTEMSKHELGEQITLRDLVKYAIIYSDNAAHSMLIGYIGKNNIRDFGTELGASYTMAEGDNYGMINTLDAIVYLNAINNFINANNQYSNEFKEILINSDQPYLNIGDIVSAHKYGNFEKYYHNIGIVYDEHPYMIAILSLEGNKKDSDYEKMIKDINGKVYELHKLYYKTRDEICYAENYLN